MHIINARLRNQEGLHELHLENGLISIIAAGRADLCCLARPHHADPYWALHAAAQLGCDQIAWPVQYLSGREQYMRNLERAADLAISV